MKACKWKNALFCIVSNYFLTEWDFTLATALNLRKPQKKVADRLPNQILNLSNNKAYLLRCMKQNMFLAEKHFPF